ncbi:MAG: MFS transporter [Candidatus Lokiarchaeota archaeon]|nr:MFS transporter [Candidatus Lokiarchaeota archaeon]
MEERESLTKFTSDFHRMVRLLLFIGLAFFYLEFMIPVLADVVFMIPATKLGLIFSMQTVGYMASSPIAGFVSDRVSKKKLILVGSVGRGFAYIVLYIAVFLGSYPLFVVGTFTIGFMVSFFWVPFNSLIGSKSHKDHRSNAYGQRDYWLGISIMVGSSIGLTYSSYIGDIYPDFPLLIFLPLVIFGIANITGGLLFHKFIDENLVITIPESEFQNSKDKKSTAFWVTFGIGFLFFVLLLSSTNGSISKPFIIKYLLEVFDVDTMKAALAWVPAGILNLILAPRLGKLVDKMQPKITILITASLGAFLTWALIYLGSQNIVIFAIILVFDMAIATTGGLIIQNYLSRISKKHRGKIFGLSSFFSNAGAVIGPILGGLAWELIGRKYPFIISIIVELSLIPLYWFSVVLTQSSLEEKYSLDSIVPTADPQS